MSEFAVGKIEQLNAKTLRIELPVGNGIYLTALEKRVKDLEKKVADLERQLQEQPEKTINKLVDSLAKTIGPKVIFDSRSLD